MKLTPLASGSSGNSFLVQGAAGSFLVDAGLSAKRIGERLSRVGVDPASLNGILVSHGHSDHVKGVGALSRKYKLPIWMNRETWNLVKDSMGKIYKLEIFETGRVFEFAGFRIHPFSVPHDCVDPVGFRICQGTARLGIATDLGTATGLVTNLLTDLQVIVIESNHDPQMLLDGPYPWELKQRVRGRLGHLSNPDTARLLQRVFSDQLQAVVLAHMSETNNRAELALKCARTSLGEFLDHNNGMLCCATQHEIGPTIEW
jgi:phosphoribosyl 1,2-cyclic phosphodiesterase